LIMAFPSEGPSPCCDNVSRGIIVPKLNQPKKKPG
jgi:hypothetical protein